MLRFFAVVLLGGLAGSVSAAPLAAQAPAGQTAPQADSSQHGETPADAPHLPAAPKGKSTILGGEIRKVDPVRDVLTLKAYGQKPVKIWFDERTQIFLDGKKIPLRELKAADHASVQTILDGVNVFALSVHILSKSPEGDYQGHVLSYNPQTTELLLSSVDTRQPMKLMVPTTAIVERQGQPSFVAGKGGFADLVKGSLVTAKFETDNAGHGVASRITVLATPGAEFVFIGNVTGLDTAAGTFVLVDPRDDKSYQISFNPGSLPASQGLKLGQHVNVTTSFDGSAYVAKSLTVE